MIAPGGDHFGAADLVIRGGFVVVPEEQGGIIEGDVVVRDCRIVSVGAPFSGVARRVVDATHGVVVPGLVNAHMHECLERGIFEDLPFLRWLEDFALPKDRAYEPRHQRAAALLNQLEMIRGGTTTFIDIFRHPDEAATVALTSGLRAVISPQVIQSVPGAGETLEANIDFVERWHGRSDRIQAWFGPHALYSCEADTFSVMSRHAARLGVGLHTHLAESRDEVRTISEGTGLRPAAYLDRLIDPGHRVLVAHAVHLTDAEIELVASRGWAVAHCPTSNMKLGNGVARVPALLAAGVTVGLGTDSVMTNNNLDLFEEMRQAALVQKLTLEDATVMSCREVFAMATTGSAAALGLGDQIATIEVGRRADLIIVGLDACHLWPLLTGAHNNVLAQLVYSAHATDVRTTIVDGEVLMEDGVVATIDQDEVSELVGREARDLLTKAGVLHAGCRHG
jgi:5-methylthioadenosine/S-adenosylhomocysteine deaminase